MRVFINRDIKKLFLLLACVFVLFIALSQAYCLFAFGAINLMLFLKHMAMVKQQLKH